MAAAGRSGLLRREPSELLFNLVAEHFRVLGEPARLELLHALADGERSTSALLEQTGMSQANLSKHMTVLCQAGFAARRRDGSFVHYRLADDHVLSLCELMCDRVEARVTATQELMASG